MRYAEGVLDRFDRWDPHDGSKIRRDGYVSYRVGSDGAMVAVLPGRCRSGAHALDEVGYRAVESDGVLYVSCSACHASTPERGERCWALSTAWRHAARAELDQHPYAVLATQLRDQGDGS